MHESSSQKTEKRGDSGYGRGYQGVGARAGVMRARGAIEHAAHRRNGRIQGRDDAEEMQLAVAAVIGQIVASGIGRGRRRIDRLAIGLHDRVIGAREARGLGMKRPTQRVAKKAKRQQALQEGRKFGWVTRHAIYSSM
ncbi:hypothetical protein ACS8YF_04890 [Salinisphaera sp. SWV1]|uniref:hypothetical protein n=1 Tax=Salinisphaera sp. SWV1 TaxID=3454139 RepID=UPI003F84837D